MSSGFQTEITGISAPLLSAVIEPISDINLSNTDLSTAGWPTGIDQVDPSTPTLVLDFNYNSPIPWYQLNGDGGDVTMSQNGVPLSVNVGISLPELTDQNNGELIVPLIEQNLDYSGWQAIPMSPGNYQLTLVGFSGLALTIEPTGTAAFSDQTIAQIGILGEGASFATVPASNVLGTLGTGIQTVSDQSLNPADPTTAVQLYEFTLAPGHHWRVGAGILASSIGSRLSADLTLFDSQGDVLATGMSGSGLANDPTDPYLFAGLAPGTYYIGVSAAQDLPYSSSDPGGYNPVNGEPGYLGESPLPGNLPFDLQLVANTADQPTTVTGFTLNSINPPESGLTGFTVTFSGPVNASQLFTTDAQQSALEVVDSSGQVWPTTAITYQVQGSRLEMIFDQALSPGSYSLIDPTQGGLTDLAGDPIVGGSNGTNVLATWSVNPSVWIAPRGGPDSLGVLWPLAADVTWPSPRAGFQETTALAAGQSVSYQFDILVPAIYNLEVHLPKGAVQVTISGENGSRVYDQVDRNAINDLYPQLTSGVYTLTFTSLSSESISLSWFIKPSRLDYESIAVNGIGQDSALAFWLTPSAVSVNSVSSLGTDSASSGGSVSSGIGPAAGGGVSGSQGALAWTSATEPATSVFLPASPIPTSLLVTLDSNVVGLPVGNAMNVAAVGPMVELGMVAVADRSNGAMLGIRYGASTETEPPAPGATESPDATVADDSPTKPQTIKVTAVKARDPEAASLNADRRALAQAEWLVRLAMGLGEQLGLRRSRDDEAADRVAQAKVTQAPFLVQVSTRGGKGSEEKAASVDSGRFDAGMPIGIVVMAAVSYQMRRPIRRWWRGRQEVPVLNRVERLPLGHGPHRRLISQGTKRRDPRNVTS